MDTRSDRDATSESPALSRREVLRLAALSPLGLAVSGQAAAQVLSRVSVQARVPIQREPTAGRWQPWLVPSVRSARPSRPPSPGSLRSRTELRELLDLQSQRGDSIRAVIDFWEPQGGILRWTQLFLDKIKENRVNPVRTARALALFHTAIADATLCAWDAKFGYDRPQPASLNRNIRPASTADTRLPAYVSEHAAVAAAAASVLNALFPSQTAVIHGQRMTFDAIANEAALSRLWAGTNYRSDLEVGMRVGQSIGWMAVARGQSDGAGAVWDANTQPGRLGATPPVSGAAAPYWSPTPPANTFPPLEPLAGYWDTWLLTSPDQFRPPTPPALEGGFPSARFLAETLEVKQTVDSLSAAQLQIANFWADGAGTVTPPGHWIQIAAEQIAAARMSTPRAARALALLAVGLADSAIACWDAKYAYWLMRPITAIRTMAGQPFYDPSFLTPIVTPPFPAYTSGHSTFSGCSAAVLELLFPGGKVRDALGQEIGYIAAAEQAAVSRLYGGIHYRSDNDAGLECGQKVAGVVIARARRDGAPA